MDERVPKKESKTSLNATKNAAQTAAAERTSVLIPPIINMSRLGKYQAYTLTISVEKTEDLYIHAQKAMEIAQGILEPFEQEVFYYHLNQMLIQV